MKAALCKSLDGPPGLVIEDIATPQPGPGEVLIAVAVQMLITGLRVALDKPLAV